MTTLSTPHGESPAQPDVESKCPSFSLTGQEGVRHRQLARHRPGDRAGAGLGRGRRGHQLQHRRRRRRGGLQDRSATWAARRNYYAHNVGAGAEVEAMCDEVKRDFGNIDILVNNAAINRDRSFKKLTKEAWDEVINTDLTSVFLVTKQFIDDMAERGWGRVINISSIVGRDRQLRPGQLRRRQGGHDRPDQDAGPRVRPQGRDRQRRRPGLHQDADDRGDPREGDGAVLGTTPVGRMGDPWRSPPGVLYLASPRPGSSPGSCSISTGVLM